MKTSKRLLLANSTTAFILAGMIATTLHELAHFGMSLLLHEPAILYPPFVGNHPNISNNHNLLIASAGPLFSLLGGLAIIAITKNKGRGFTKLFLLWLGFLSAEIGFGYLFIAPFVKVGDTGLVLSILHATWLVYALVFLLGVFGYLFLLPRLFGRQVSKLVADKKAFYYAGMYPWLLGTGTLLIVYFLIENVIMKALDINLFSLMGVVTIGIFTPWASYTATAKNTHQLQLKTPVVGIVLAILVALLLMFGLTHGIQSGTGPFA